MALEAQVVRQEQLALVEAKAHEAEKVPEVALEHFGQPRHLQ
jgi:uncharacterized protein YcgL (UPF0745 family)